MVILSDQHREVLENIFSSFTEERLPFLVLRNYEGFPIKMGRDLDVFCPASDLERAIEIVQREVRRQDGHVAHVYQRHHLTALYLSLPSASGILHLDLYHGSFSWAGLRYVADEEVIASRRAFRTFFIPGPHHEAALLLLASVLDGGFVKSRYLPKIYRLIEPDSERRAFFSLFENNFGKKAATTVEEFLFGAAPVSEESPQLPAPRLAKRLRRGLIQTHWVKSPLRSLNAMRHFVLDEIQRFRKPSGLMIVITGPDGAGKSTVIENLSAQLESWLCLPACFHWRPAILPDVGVLFKRRAAPREKKAVHSDPHGRPPHGSFAGFFRLGYYGLDYWLGYLFYIRRIVAKNRVVIFDRYTLDVICDPRRFRFAMRPGWLQKFVRWTPKADLTIALTAPGAVLNMRKPEVTLQEAERQAGAYREAALASPNGFSVDAAQPLGKVTAETLAIVLSELRRRAERTLSRKSPSISCSKAP